MHDRYVPIAIGRGRCGDCVEGEVPGTPQAYLPDMSRRFIVTLMLYAVAITTPILAVSHSVGERKADEDAKTLLVAIPGKCPMR